MGQFLVFTEFVTILLLCFRVLALKHVFGFWHLSFPNRDQTHTPCIGRQSLNHWTAREVPRTSVLTVRQNLVSASSSKTFQTPPTLPLQGRKNNFLCTLLCSWLRPPAIENRLIGDKQKLNNTYCCCCSVAKSCLTLWPHELQHTRLPCPSLSPWICSNSCPTCVAIPNIFSLILVQDHRSLGTLK